ncbi:MAG: hypothetical protein QOJ96_2362 [Alphaproteobacteria bacterium]|nr:hypothetical protein [Alphaproteobacteria bacterium]
MTNSRIIFAAVAILIAACAPQGDVPKMPPGAQDNFFQILAAWCKQYPDANSWQACPVCNSQTCPTCAPDPAREQHVASCNPNSWDCAGSVVFVPNDGASCGYAPNGACDCPVPGESLRGKRPPKSLRSKAGVAPAAFSPRSVMPDRPR